MENKIIIMLTCFCFISCIQTDKTYVDNVSNKDAYKNSEKLSDPFIGKKDSTFTNFIFNDVYYKYYFRKPVKRADQVALAR